MRIGVIGAGAIGGFLAAAFVRAGFAVGLVARGAHLEAIQRDGLQVRSDLGDFSVRLLAVAEPRELGPCDVLLLTFKSHQWPSLIDGIATAAGDSTTVVTLQNGVPFWFLREPPLASVDPGGRIGRHFPQERTLAGVVHISGRLAAPGILVQSGGLRFSLGEPEGGSSHRVAALREAFAAAGLAPEEDAAIRTAVWLKLVNNVGLNPMSVLTGMTIHAMLADVVVRKQIAALMAETVAVGRTVGITAPVDIEARMSYASRLADVKTSMLQDFEAGRDLELEPILGSVLELARRAELAVPNIARTYAQVHERMRARG